MKHPTKAYRLRLYSLILNCIAIIAVLAIVVGAIVTFITSTDSLIGIFALFKYFFDSYIFVTILGSIAIFCFVLSSVLDHLRTNDKHQLYMFIGKTAGMLAILTIPSMPIVGQLFCTKNMSGSGCDLSGLGIVFYFLAAAMIFGVVSIVAFIEAYRLSDK
jgi:hypothetical protein